MIYQERSDRKKPRPDASQLEEAAASRNDELTPLLNESNVTPVGGDPEPGPFSNVIPGRFRANFALNDGLVQTALRIAAGQADERRRPLRRIPDELETTFAYPPTLPPSSYN